MNFDLEHGPAGDAYKLLVGLVAPRPIALITSVNENGLLNAAPFSAYNYLCTDPPIVGVGVTNRPDQRFTPKIRRATYGAPVNLWST
jgi:flavin reductase (DIM6/NTAB) family NADH-FMN oxidoreductase RutF